MPKRIPLKPWSEKQMEAKLKALREEMVEERKKANKKAIAIMKEKKRNVRRIQRRINKVQKALDKAKRRK